jgi:RNA polymerase sigma-70 factor (ECF subfamily)
MASVFINEGRRVGAGEAILSEAATPARSQDEVVEDLVLQYSRLVYHIAYAVLRSHQDAEDATQECFLRVLRQGSKLMDIEDHKAWLARIAWRVAVDRSRQRGRQREIPLGDPEKPSEEPQSSDASADEVLAGGQVGMALAQLIEALPTKLRESLVLATVEEMSPREVAATLAVNEATVRSRVFRARQILREKLVARFGARK